MHHGRKQHYELFSNVDEFGLFYQCFPNKVLHFKGNKCSWGKHSKVCQTSLVAGNASGERLHMFVIGKSEKPRCFKGVKHLPCRYRAQRTIAGCQQNFLKIEEESLIQ